MSEAVRIEQKGGELHVTTKLPRMTYLSNVMRANCFPELHDLFRHAHSPPKELTESYAAFQHLRGWLRNHEWCRVLHVGDGAHARTAALFAFLAGNTDNVAIDPNTNIERVRDWRARWGVRRFYALKAEAGSPLQRFLLDGLGEAPLFVTFVHAHVDTDEVLDALPRWDIAFTMACCQPQRQLSQRQRIVKEGRDWNVLSEQRYYQVLTPREA